MPPGHLRSDIVRSTARLADAGVGSPRVDAEELAAHVLGVPRGRLLLIDDAAYSPEAAERFIDLVERRAGRIPLQHLTGTAPFDGIDLAVGPGVFVPRPETELLVAAAVAALPTDRPTLVVDLCAGTGAIGLAIARRRPRATVHAVEVDDRALEWLRRNRDRRSAAGDTPIVVHAGDAADVGALGLDGTVDVVAVNPPYVPTDAVLEPEVVDHDPHRALFGDRDGLATITRLIDPIARLLAPGGIAVMEHDDSHAAAVAALFERHGAFDETVRHRDLAGRERFVVTRRAAVRRGT